jgi:hypothetical protein
MWAPQRSPRWVVWDLIRRITSEKPDVLVRSDATTDRVSVVYHSLLEALPGDREDLAKVIRGRPVECSALRALTGEFEAPAWRHNGALIRIFAHLDARIPEPGPALALACVPDTPLARAALPPRPTPMPADAWEPDDDSLLNADIPAWIQTGNDSPPSSGRKPPTKSSTPSPAR